MPLLYFWRGDNYRRDLDMGAGYHLNQANPAMHRVDIGDSLWAFTRDSRGRYVLAAELVVRAKTLNPPMFRYGRYRIWGDLRISRYFKVEGQPSIERVIRSLSSRASAAVLGSSFQGMAAVRLINLEDHLTLRVAARDLALEPRARLLPEDQLEAKILLGDSEDVYALIQQEHPGIAEQRREYLYREVPARNGHLVQQLREVYDGRCQICQWDPRRTYGHQLCHGHHLQWLSQGGDDTTENMVLVCPNHHAAIHRCAAPFDYGDLAFDFADHREPLRLNHHLQV